MDEEVGSSSRSPGAAACANDDDDMTLLLRHLLSTPAPSGSQTGKDVLFPGLVALGLDRAASAAVESSSGIPSLAGPEVSGAISGKRREGDAGDLNEIECDSEKGTDVAEEPSKPAAPRTGLKRSRAAEVHNLSEKRRRSRINEKMKALQKLIPNSNKTDKASMLDEAIEYLKQLQLQVQMLSVRNGLNLHPVCLPGAMQSLQLSQINIGFGLGDDPLHVNKVGGGILHTNLDYPVETSFGVSHQSTPSHQRATLPDMLDMVKTETLSGLHLSRIQLGSVQVNNTDEELRGQSILQASKGAVIQSTSTSDSILDKVSCLQTCFLRPENSQDMLQKDVKDNQMLVEHFPSVEMDQILREAVDSKRTDF